MDIKAIGVISHLKLYALCTVSNAHKFEEIQNTDTTICPKPFGMLTIL